MDNSNDLSQNPMNIKLPTKCDKLYQNNVDNDNIIADIITCGDLNESSLLNSIVEAVMRGDMNEVVTLALSHRNTDSKERGIVDQALSTALRNKFKSDKAKELEKEIYIDNKAESLEKEEDATDLQIDSDLERIATNSVYPTMTKSDENNETRCSYYIDHSSTVESSKNTAFCQAGFNNQNIEVENQFEDLSNVNFSNYQTSTSSFHNIESVNSLNSSQQSVQVQLPGIGNFLLQIPSNFRPGEPITLPINLPLTPLSQPSGANPISINMANGQLISNQLLSIYNPSLYMNNMTNGKKMRAIAPKPSKPVYRQPLIAPKTSSPNSSIFNQDGINNVNSTSILAPSGPGRRKGAKGKKTGRKRGTHPKSRKDSNYASSTHSIDSQDASQFNEPSNTLKQNCNNFNSGLNTYQCNYFVNNDSSDYINQSRVLPHSYNDHHSNNLIDTSDSGEKDLLSLAWEISNADLGNNDDFNAAYQLYDANNLSSEGFVSSEILDQFLQNIQKDDISEMSICCSAQINVDSRVSYASSFTTLPPCSTVLPSVTNSSNNQSNLELSQCIEIAEIVNLNTEDMLSELENEENALLDKFVAQYSSNSISFHKSKKSDLHSSLQMEMMKYSSGNKPDFSDKEMDPNVKESNELSEIAKQIEKDCDVSNIGNSSISRNYLSHRDYDYQTQVDNLNKCNNTILNHSYGTYNLTHSGNFCRNVTAPLELIYSTSVDSFNPSLEGKSHYLMPVNMDKIQGEPTYYITDGSLKSKTLDDFGLLDFCTDTGDNDYSETNGLDDKKYMEPPILEDISDATPISSDDESDDDDIDLNAFKLSSFNHMTLISNHLSQNIADNIVDIWKTSDLKDLPTFLEISKFEQQSFSLDNWYTNGHFINILDTFLSLPIDHLNEDNTHKIILNDINSNENEDNKEVKDAIIKAHVTPEPVKRRRSKKNVNNSNLTDLCNYKDKLSRLRKPPIKLAIYHSIKSIDNDFLVKKPDEVQPCRVLEVSKGKKEAVKSVKSSYSSKVNHCTRSKVLISKSYDSFYETLEKTIRHQHRKIKKNNNHMHNKIKHQSNTESSVLKYKNLTVSQPNDSINITTLDVIPVVRSVGMQYKKIQNISRSYNLRKHSIENNKIVKHIYEKRSHCMNKKNDLLMMKSKKRCNGDVQNIEIINENDVTKTVIIGEFAEHFDDLIENDPIVEQRINPINSNLGLLHKATVDMISLPTNNVFEILINDYTLKIDTSDYSFKKSFPVRKINRKLRLLSGLEPDKYINYAAIVEFQNCDNLTDYTLELQAVKVCVFVNLLKSSFECKYSKMDYLQAKFECQTFGINDEDFDDVDSCDVRLVIVENEEILNPTLIANSKTNNPERCNSVDINIKSDSNEVDISRKSTLRNKSRGIVNAISDILKEMPRSPSPLSLRRQPLRRSCKKMENYQLDIISENQHIDDIHSLITYSLKTPVCNVEKLANCVVLPVNDVSLVNAVYSHSNYFPDKDYVYNVHSDAIQNNLKYSTTDDNFKLNFDDNVMSVAKISEIKYKIQKRLQDNKSKLKVYQNHLKCIWRSKINKETNYRSRLKRRIRPKEITIEPIITESIKSIENGIAKINFQSDDLSGFSNENEPIEVDDDIPKNPLCTFVDSNNVEIVSRNYGTFSLKIKFQKQDPPFLPDYIHHTKKQKRNSRKRKRLRHFLNSIIGSKDSRSNKSSSGHESVDEEFNYDTKYKTRKRKHSNTTFGSVDSSNQENINQSDKPPNLSLESNIIEEDEHQKPIKIKLFKSTNEDISKSEDMIFSLKKSNFGNRKVKSSAPKMLQVLKDQQFKPCRQAANLAKKKIFSTAKEDRRSQNATLTSIWNPRKSNIAFNKMPTDFINLYNNHRRRPRGRPPKSINPNNFSEKYMSSTGTLKLKIRLSDDFKNCNDDHFSSTGENSGRTSTNDSSILNLAVAGINGSSDALSLESNNFINGLTHQLDDNMEYLEAKEAKVYFDPNQVDIEKIKNSYYSNKKCNPNHFDCSTQQNSYGNIDSELCDVKKDSISIDRDFSQYNGDEISQQYNSSLTKNYPCQNKISHLPKDLTNITKNGYNILSTNREPQDLSQTNQTYSFDNQISSSGKDQSEMWQCSKSNSSDLLSHCRNGNNIWSSKHSSFPNSESVMYDSYSTPNIKEMKICTSENQSSPFMPCENETSDTKHIENSHSKQSSVKGRKSSINSFESQNQLSPNLSRNGLGSVPPQLNIHTWSDETNHNSSLNNTAAAWVTYAQQQAAAAAYMDPQMKAYYNLALSQSMLNNPYCGTYGNPAGNPENFYASLHSQYLNNSKDLNEKDNNLSGSIRTNNDPMGTFMEATQMTSWEHFYSAAAMAGYHNSSQGVMEEYTGRAGSMLHARHMLAGNYSGSALSRDHFQIEGIKPPVAHQNQSGSSSPMKPISSPPPISSVQAYSHVQMPYGHFNGFF